MSELERTQNFLQWYKENESKHKEFAKYVLDKITEALKDRNILYAYKTSRAKTVSSLTEKCAKKWLDEKTGSYVLKYNDPKNQITDLSGARIVCYLPQDLPAVQHIIEKMFDIDEANSMDKSKLLKANEVGYLSIHYIVSLREEQLSTELRKYKGMKCEVQLRTVLQDAWSQVFHDRQYKNNNGNIEIPEEVLRETNLIAGSLEFLDNEIGRLVKKYDDLADGINNIIYQELLDCSINKENIEKYFGIKFIRLGSRFYSYEDISRILEKYGIITIRDIDTMFDDGLVQEIYKLHIQLTIDKILMYGMIVNNSDKFFAIEENKDVLISQEAFQLLEKFVDMDDICKKYKLKTKE